MSKKIWIEIETTKNTTTTVSLRGFMDKDVFDAIINETYTKKWLKLDDVSWTETENEIYRILGNDSGKYHDFTGELFIQTHTIIMIYLLGSGGEALICDS